MSAVEFYLQLQLTAILSVVNWEMFEIPILNAYDANDAVNRLDAASEDSRISLSSIQQL